jgi:hypothetical protein
MVYDFAARAGSRLGRTPQPHWEDGKDIRATIRNIVEAGDKD